MNKQYKSIAVETVEMVAVIVLIAIIAFLGVEIYETNFNTSTSQENTTHDTDLLEENYFDFAALGDIGTTNEASMVLGSLSQSQTDFTLVLGDLGYGPAGSEPAWCDLVKTNLGDSYPFEILVGNHDTQWPGIGSDILEYRKCLPNRIDGLVGDYAIEYYFDYKDLARVIMVSPDVDRYGFDYIKGTEHYNWVASVIDEAKENNTPWVILGMHENCITIGSKECEIGEDLMNLSIEKGVDLVLQGHEHSYFRSKQLAHSDNCPTVLANTVVTECISNQNGQFVKDQGTVFVISGAGGHSLRDVNFNDSEIGYFEAMNGANTGSSFGYSLFTVRQNAIEGSFVPVTGGDFRDSFKITK